MGCSFPRAPKPDWGAPRPLLLGTRRSTQFKAPRAVDVEELSDGVRQVLGARGAHGSRDTWCHKVLAQLLRLRERRGRSSYTGVRNTRAYANGHFKRHLITAASTLSYVAVCNMSCVVRFGCDKQSYEYPSPWVRGRSVFSNACGPRLTDTKCRLSGSCSCTATCLTASQRAAPESRSLRCRTGSWFPGRAEGRGGRGTSTKQQQHT